MRHRLIKNGIKIRSISEGVNLTLTEKDHITLSKENEEILIGNLIGDGCLRKRDKETRARYSHVDKNSEYLVWLKSCFERDNITFSDIYIHKKSGCFALQSHTFEVFNKYKSLFYPDKKRIVPQNIKLTPIILRQWYISDGSVATHGGRYIAKEIKDPTILLDELHKIFGNEVKYHQSSGKFYFPKSCVLDFLNYIGESPVDCYKYKWELR